MSDGDSALDYDGAATIELVSMYTDDPTYYAKCAIERVRELL